MKNETDLRGKTCCFTGHRDLPEDKIPIIRQNLRKSLISAIEHGYIYFGAGGAVGFDTLAAQTVLELKAEYPEIKLILVLPCKNQTLKWPAADIAEYERIMEKADKIKYTSEHYFPGCMQKRNRRLVDFSSLCICYLTKPSGGTAYTVDYAQKKGLTILSVPDFRF